MLNKLMTKCLEQKINTITHKNFGYGDNEDGDMEEISLLG